MTTTPTTAGTSVHTEWRALGEEEGFVVVWPQPTARAQGGGSPVWNAGFGSHGKRAGRELENVDDVGFLRRLAVNVSTTYGADIGRHVYWLGSSTGCAMAQRMVAELSDVGAAAGCASDVQLESQRALSTRLMWDVMKRRTPRLLVSPSLFAGTVPRPHAVARREDPAGISTAPSSSPTPEGEDDDDADDSRNIRRICIATSLVVVVLVTCVCVCKIMYPVMSEVANGALDKPAGPTSLSVLAEESPNFSEHGFVN